MIPPLLSAETRLTAARNYSSIKLATVDFHRQRYYPTATEPWQSFVNLEDTAATIWQVFSLTCHILYNQGDYLVPALIATRRNLQPWRNTRRYGKLVEWLALPILARLLKNSSQDSFKCH